MMIMIMIIPYLTIIKIILITILYNYLDSLLIKLFVAFSYAVIMDKAFLSRLVTINSQNGGFLCYINK